MAYEEKYRKRTIEYRQEGHTIEETSRVFKVSPTAIKRWQKQYEETGSLKKKPLKRKHKKIPPAELEEYVKEHADAYLSEIAQVFHCSDTAVGKALKKLGITRKKRQSGTGNKIP